MYTRAATLLLAAVLAMTSCGSDSADTASDGMIPISGAEATSMHLKHSEGQVGVLDGEGNGVEAMENLGLYSGYHVDTQAASYAWIDLDEVKLTKMDQNSEVAIYKEDRHLELQVTSGSLFFHVTRPLEEDETMNIRTSTMMLGIRGTCGWVNVTGPEHMSVYILEGTVECTVTEVSGRTVTVRISGGETAELYLDSDGKGSIVRGEFGKEEVPAFVLDEIQEDSELQVQISEASGMNFGDGVGMSISAADLEAVGYMGDANACVLTPELAEAYAQVLREEIEKAEAAFRPNTESYVVASEPRCYAGLLDVGGDNPVLLFGSAKAERTIYTQDDNWNLEIMALDGYTTWGIWEYVEGRAVQFADRDKVSVYADHLLVGGSYPDGTGYGASVYLFENGRIGSEPVTTSWQELTGWDAENGSQYDSTIDGQTATKEAVDSWKQQWGGENSLAGYSYGGGTDVWFWGLSPAKSVLSVLEGNGPLTEEDMEGAGTVGSISIRTVVSYDPNTMIRHTDVDPGGYNLKAYYEIPVFPENTEGCRNINMFFQAMEDDFLSLDEGELRELFDYLQEGYEGDTLEDYWSVRINDYTDKYICVGHYGYSYMGGPHGVDMNKNYTFRADTGEQLYLSDVANASPEEITAFLLEAIEAQDGGNGVIDMETFRAYEADDYGFYIRDGRLYAAFERYEGVSYAYGVIADIELTMGLKDEWK